MCSTESDFCWFLPKPGWFYRLTRRVFRRRSIFARKELSNLFDHSNRSVFCRSQIFFVFVLLRGSDRPIWYSFVRTHTMLAAFLSANTLYPAALPLLTAGVMQHRKGMIIAQDILGGEPCGRRCQNRQRRPPTCFPLGGG